ncbi:MAG: preprotein translocase subunit SecG [Dehalococcoidia bacterium]
MLTSLYVAQIVVSVALVASVLFQLRGGGIGGIFGQADSVYRNRRGIESTLFKLTIVLISLIVVFAVLAATLG